MTQEAPPAGTRTRLPSWVPFGALVGIEFLTVMDAAVVNIALPVIKDDLGYSHTEISWVVNCYLIAFAGLLLAAGRLADALGRRRLFVAGTALFTAASVGCGLAVEPWHLLIGRAVQGVGAALVMPAALALITDIFPEGPSRVRALGIFASLGAVAAPIGLTVGGFFTELDWHLIFWTNVPLGVIITAIALTGLPAPPPTPTPVDLLGAVAATGTLSLAALAAVSLEASGPSAATTIAATVGAVVFALILALRQRYAANPLIPPALLRIRSITVGNSIFALVGTVLLGTFFFVTLYLQETRGLAPLQATLAYVPIPLAAFTGTRLAPWIIGRLGPHNALGMGLLVQAATLAIWAIVGDASGPLSIALVAPTVPWGVGMGVSIVSSFVVCTSAVPGSVAGAASGLATTAYQGGGAVGLALVAALAAATGDAGSGSPGLTQAAQLSGYHWGIWALAGTALIGAALTRALPRSQQEPAALENPDTPTTG
ncbi:MFS transporter [Jiangella alkaliphila]|uniref:Predicted arabinose efflux permease, MFS family n=1 Tax=Jiangella alkaliphila TaxID=419479 RepID=A0A1H2JQH5_9ACTN|nr:MFS transporter [Jiangella alkaliphila]SDU58632.1 Predicted arabinose efflux permease, MFS family [Jiangella alkaliphila]